MIHGRWAFLLLVATVWLAFGRAHAHENDYTAVSVEVASGGLEDTGGYYRYLEFGWHRGWDAEEWIEENLGLNVGGRWDYHVSYYAGGIKEPQGNVELQVAAGLRFGIPLGDDWLPYIVGGTGPLLTTQNLAEQATDLNWGSFAGIGVEYRLDEESALALQVSTRHFSNASIQDPNSGVDTNAITLKYMWYDD